ncbi:60S ribosomal protein L18, partial [Clostridioides difficile]|nr:60S ribosomal protein L18 [Clostridioides difficile]
MGIDLVAGGKVVGKKNRTNPKSDNVYLNLLVRLYRFLARRTDAKFNDIVLRRLYQSNTNQAPLSLGKVARFMKKHEGKIAVVVGTVTDDIRLLNVPKLSVVALNFTETARARIVKAGGECLSFD